MTRRTISLTLLLWAITQGDGRAQSACEIEWDDPIRISADSSVATLPRLAVTGGPERGNRRIHLLWYGLDTTVEGSLAQSGVQYARSTDGGAAFSAPVRLLSPFESFPGFLAADGEFVFVAAAAILDTFFGTAVFVSSDAGDTWSLPSRVLAGSFPEILFTADGFLYLGVREIETASFGILRSSDHGASWTQLARRIREISDVAVLPGRIHGIGAVPGASQLESAHYVSGDSGRTWFGPGLISPEDLVRSTSPAIAVNPRRHLFASWTDTGTIMYRYSRNEGISWGPWIRLSGEPGNVRSDLAADEAYVAAAWDRDIAGVRGIHARVSNDFGLSFCPEIVPGGGDGAREPVLSVIDSTMSIAWVDDTPADSAGGGVFFRIGILPGDVSGGAGPPRAFALNPTYPNPTNAFAFVGFDVPAASDVTIGLYNVLGEAVTGPRTAAYGPGRYSEALEVGALPSGMYYVRVSAPGWESVGKLMVVR